MQRFSEPRDLIDEFVMALNAKDADRLGPLFAEDAKFVNVRGALMHGRKGIVEGHAASFAGPLAGSTFRFDSIEELSVTNNVTVLHAHAVRDLLPDASPGTGPALTSILQLVARRGREGWQVVAATNVPETAPPGPSRR